MEQNTILIIFFVALFLILALKIIRAVKNNEENKKPSDKIDIDSLNISNLDEKLKQVIKYDGKLAAIKLYREFSNADLQRAKDYIDNLYQNM